MRVNKESAIKKYEAELQCNCDLDRWEPEKLTGHSWVCRIHKAVIREIHNREIRK